MVTKMAKGWGGRRSFNVVTWAILFFYACHLFYFFILINLNSFSPIYHLFHILMSIKNLQMTSLSVDAFYILAFLNEMPWDRPSPWVFTKRFFIFVITWNSPQQFCRKPFDIFAEHLSVFLQNTSQYFCRKFLWSFAENLSVCFHYTFQHLCRTYLSSSTELLGVLSWGHLFSIFV